MEFILYISLLLAGGFNSTKNMGKDFFYNSLLQILYVYYIFITENIQKLLSITFNEIGKEYGLNINVSKS